jgi:hypothetical protein
MTNGAWTRVELLPALSLARATSRYRPGRSRLPSRRPLNLKLLRPLWPRRVREPRVRSLPATTRTTWNLTVAGSLRE